RPGDVPDTRHAYAAPIGAHGRPVARTLPLRLPGPGAKIKGGTSGYTSWGAVVAAMPRSTPGGHRDPPSGSVAPNGDPLLAARFTVPVPPRTVVRRPRLTEWLSQGVEGPLTLVNGPAGAGKTLLVADWIAAGGPLGPVAWLSVEPEDNGPGVFWTYV